MTTRLVDRYEPLLGTVVEIRIELVGKGRDAEADALSEAMADEIVRLQSVLSSVDPTSEFSVWARGGVADPTPELAEVLSLSAIWQERSRGRFNPAAGRLSEAWADASRNGVEPTSGALADLVADIGRPRWTADDGCVTQLLDASDCTLNAIAKGWIADRAVDLALAVDGLELAAVNAGGDIAARGPAMLPVGIEDPARPYDNVAPLTVVGLRSAGLATSGSVRRGFEIDGVHRSHVLDPRTGRPVDAIASISVVAPTTAEADVIATVLGVIDPADAIAEAATMDVACMIVTDDGRRLATESWNALEIVPGERRSG